MRSPETPSAPDGAGPQARGKLTEAEPLLRRVLADHEARLGASHPTTLATVPEAVVGAQRRVLDLLAIVTWEFWSQVLGFQT